MTHGFWDAAAAITWVGEQPDRDRVRCNKLLDVVVDGLRPPAA